MAEHFIGVDVGTGSARAGVFDATGTMLASAKRNIALYLEAGDIAEQSSENIWQAVCASVSEAVELAVLIRQPSMASASTPPVRSLSRVKAASHYPSARPAIPIAISSSGWITVLSTGPERINATRHKVLDYVGGTVSPEMETPKLLWLAEHMPQTFAAARQFFDLADYLTRRATGSLTRSICTLTCKWTYLGHEGRWDADYFETIGLGSLAREGFAHIGTEVVPGGTALGQGLSPAAAASMSLPTGIAVGAGLIDAHAGGIGTVGARGGAGDVQSRMAYVFGTSACTMATTAQPSFVPGVWGPYYSAMVPGLWLNEGGQSAAGAAIEQLVQFHPAAPEASRIAASEGLSLVAWLAEEAQRRGGAASAPALIGDIHVVPEFLGNRSPFADPEAKALIAGPGMDRSMDNSVGLYLAGICGLAYGVRQILAAMAQQGTTIDTIVISGGAGQSATGPPDIGRRHWYHYSCYAIRRTGAVGLRHPGRGGSGTLCRHQRRHARHVRNRRDLSA
ncbi:FGGY family pentulose kinase [Devosia sp. A8/3-2]|nr:FGGY family pentulose kinase [Devosia sp. A8/3-2]